MTSEGLRPPTHAKQSKQKDLTSSFSLLSILLNFGTDVDHRFKKEGQEEENRALKDSQIILAKGFNFLLVSGALKVVPYGDSTILRQAFVPSPLGSHP